jgi:hypothetical protein
MKHYIRSSAISSMQDAENLIESELLLGGQYENAKSSLLKNIKKNCNFYVYLKNSERNREIQEQ